MRYTRSRCALAKHVRAASGILKPRSRPDNISATGCRAAEKYTRSRRALVEFSPSTPAALQVFSRREGGPATFLRLAAELMKNTHPHDVHSELCQCSPVCLLPWHLLRGGVTWSRFLRPQQRRVAANWLKPLKFPGCAAPTRRIGQLELPSDELSCAVCANFLIPTTPIS